MAARQSPRARMPRTVWLWKRTRAMSGRVATSVTSAMARMRFPITQ